MADIIKSTLLVWSNSSHQLIRKTSLWSSSTKNRSDAFYKNQTQSINPMITTILRTVNTNNNKKEMNLVFWIWGSLIDLQTFDELNPSVVWLVRALASKFWGDIGVDKNQIKVATQAFNFLLIHLWWLYVWIIMSNFLFWVVKIPCYCCWSTSKAGVNQ